MPDSSPSLRPLLTLTLALGLGLGPAVAEAAPPEHETSSFEHTEVLRVAEGPVDPVSEQDQGAIILPERETEPEASLEPEASPAPSAPQLRVVDKRPKTGTALIALGAMGMAASSMLVITAMTGPGWLDLERDRAVLAGGLAVPLGLISAGLVAGGSKSAKRYEKWARRNDLSPPPSGNGMMVAGGLITAGMLGLAAYSAQQNLIDPSPGRGAWVPTALAGGASLVGMVVFIGGGVRRSKFAAWERASYLTPGTMALRGGGGLTVSGRF